MFILSEEEQKMKKLLWMKMNRKWLDKQEHREEVAERIVKKR